MAATEEREALIRKQGLGSAAGMHATVENDISGCMAGAWR
jgi:hypothetical protein